MTEALKIGCIGAGGYAGSMIMQFNKWVPAELGKLAVVSTSRPESAKENEHIQAQGSDVVSDIDALVNYPGLDGVIIPTSIDSHLPYTTKALEAGLHVLVEKPVAATIDEVDQMIAARDKAGKTVAIGFQDTYSDCVQWAKQLIVEGKLGKIKRAKVWALWPRTDSYYQRNSWAALVQRDGVWVLDSPANNALAHQINMMLYMTGQDMASSNQPGQVTAELYRGRDIENYDTCGIKCKTVDGIEMLILLTHACATQQDPIIEFEGEKGTIRRTHPDKCELIIDGQIVDSCVNRPEGVHGAMFVNWLKTINGQDDQVKCTIENGRAVTLVIDGASQAAKVKTVEPQYIQRDKAVFSGKEDACNVIQDIDAIFKQGFEQFQLPSETGKAPWAATPASIDLAGYSHFEGIPD